jgi:hypothetical protein
MISILRYGDHKLIIIIIEGINRYECEANEYCPSGSINGISCGDGTSLQGSDDVNDCSCSPGKFVNSSYTQCTCKYLKVEFCAWM